MGVDTAKSGKTSGGNALGDNTRYEDLMMITNNDTGDLAFAVDQESDLSPDLVRDKNNVPGEFR